MLHASVAVENLEIKSNISQSNHVGKRRVAPFNHY